jgi:predicted transcriptional regulator
MANAKHAQVVSISLPRDLLRDVERLRRRYFRKRSEIFQEAVRQYVARHRRIVYGSPEYWAEAVAAVPVEDEAVDSAERAALRRGAAEIARGETVTLAAFRRKHGHVARRRRAKR